MCGDLPIRPGGTPPEKWSGKLAKNGDVWGFAHQTPPDPPLRGVWGGSEGGPKTHF